MPGREEVSRIAEQKGETFCSLGSRGLGLVGAVETGASRSKSGLDTFVEFEVESFSRDMALGEEKRGA